MIVFIIMGTLGLCGNALVIFIYIKSSSVRTPANHFIANLAVADFIIMAEAPIFVNNCIHNGPAFGRLGCTIYASLGAVGGTVAILTLMVVSIDRYNVICHPLNPSRSSTNQKSMIAIALVWIVSITFSIIPAFQLFGVRPFSPEGFLTACSFTYLDTDSANYWYIIIYALVSFQITLERMENSILYFSRRSHIFYP